MEDKKTIMSDNEILGRVIDGTANDNLRQATLERMSDNKFREFFLIALHSSLYAKF